jgi:HNH endonuclease
MVPKRSWAVKVRWSDFLASSLAEPGQMIELPTGTLVDGNLQAEDEIYLLKEKTSNPDSPAGIFAVGQVVAFNNQTIRLQLDEKRLTNKKRHLKFTALKEDPTIEDFEESYVTEWEYHLLSPRTSLRLELISIKTGHDFDRADSMRCLLAYEDCRLKGLSLEKSEPVIKAALETGRLMTSISFKLANFRALDPRVEAKGFDGVASVDRLVWDHYYQVERKDIDISRLRDDLARHEFSDPLTFVVEDKAEPAGDYQPIQDEDKRQAYARRVRKGQARFRKALHTLYGSRCAFTGTDEETVLEACHIISHAKTGDNSLDNGLLLRSDIHVLFDEHLMTLANDGQRILVHKDVTAPEYARLRGMSPGLRPSTPESHLALLRLHNLELRWAV